MSAIISTPASTTVFTISDATPDSRRAFPFFVLLIDSLTLSLSTEQVMLVIISANYSCPMQTLCSKASHDNFSKLFYLLHQ